jgi:hypothetical protein
MTRLNVSVDNPDAALQEVQDRIAGVAHVAGVRAAPDDDPATGVFGVVAAVGGDVQLDLIAHSRSSQLHLHSWLITATETATASLAADLPRNVSITEVRLLGCNTAAGKGIAAMRHVKDALVGRWPDAKVYGASCLLSVANFDANGFISPGLLEEVDTLPAGSAGALAELSVEDVAKQFAQLGPRPDPYVGTDQLLRDLILETEADARRDWSRYSSASAWQLEIATAAHPPIAALIPSDSEVRIVPGLLMLPDRELLYPIAGTSGQYQRITVLCNGLLLRVYPRSQPRGVIVRPRAPRSLAL